MILHGLCVCSLYNDTRQDELLENPIVLEKGISYSRNSWYGKLAKVRTAS